MTDFVKISDLPVINTLTDQDLFIVETSTGTKAIHRTALKEEAELPTKADVGLGNVDNTADIDKPISTATQEALDLKADSSTLDTFVQTTAPATYLTKNEASTNYLTKNVASGTYLTQENAANYYVSKANMEETLTTISNTYLSKDSASTTYVSQATFDEALSGLEELLASI